MPSGKKLKILFVTSEVVPFIKTGGLADVSSALPQNLQEMGHQVRIVVPKYGAIDERKYKIHEVVRLKDLTTKIGEKDVTFSLRSSFLIGKKARVQIYFLDNQDYFGSRHSLYSDPLSGEDFPDNDERFILLAKSVFELIIKLGWIPDIIHCNDWQCGLVPAYLKLNYQNEPGFDQIKTLFTIHNLSSQGEFPTDVFQKTGLPSELKKQAKFISDGKFNFMRAGAEYADVINTVSERYANEICSDKEFSLGLHDILKKRKDKIFGIINGIDDSVWNPEFDKNIAKRYNIKSLENKPANKKALAEKFSFDYDEKIPIIGMISRLYPSKGFDLVIEAFEELMKENLRIVLLGAGDKKYHRFFMEALSKHQSKFSCYLGFDDQLAHLIEAGSDMFLMPSQFEPCGLNQMYSLVYGSVPIVRETGGLADTVYEFDSKTGEGNGFLFKDFNKDSMMKSILKALNFYHNEPKLWHKIIKNGMRSNFSWINSSKNYIDLYRKVLGA